MSMFNQTFVPSIYMSTFVSSNNLKAHDTLLMEGLTDVWYQILLKPFISILFKI